MDKKLKAKWIKALTSGRYKQARETLKEESDVPRGKPGYCCLGVLLTIAGKGRWDNGGYVIERNGDDSIVCDGDLGATGRKFFGIPDRAETKLITMNDGTGGNGQSDFKQIAKWIRANL